MDFDVVLNYSFFCVKLWSLQNREYFFFTFFCVYKQSEIYFYFTFLPLDVRQLRDAAAKSSAGIRKF